MYSEKNTGTNLPAQIEIYATPGNEYHFLFMAKGGGSANKSYLFQQTKALLTPETLLKFIGDKIKVRLCFHVSEFTLQQSMYLYIICLQYFDAVGWVAGRAIGLYKN